MKYYSETLKKVFDSPEELEKAEKDAKAVEVKTAETKKALAKRVEEATNAVSDAYAEYEKAKDKAAEILDKSNAEVAKILQDAKDVIKKAEEEKYKAIRLFNEKFGAYTTTYNGEKALKEFDSIINRLDNWNNLLFWL